jgi:predicted ATPase
LKISELNLSAGREAASISAFLLSSESCRAGVKLLGPTPFKEHYKLALELNTLQAQVELAATRMDESRKAVDMILNEANTEEDRISAEFLMVEFLFAHSLLEEAVAFPVDWLNQLGGNILKSPNVLQAKLASQKDKHAIKKIFKETILGLPVIENDALRIFIFT